MKPVNSGGLRSRKLDPKKHLGVYRYDQIVDLEDDPASRAIPRIASGVEKEEEDEHHLQAALLAYSTYTQVFIPTPDASHAIQTAQYDRFYDSSFVLPKSLIKFSTSVEEAIGCPYNLDETDDGWYASATVSIAKKETPLKESLSEEELEWAFYTLEMSTFEKIGGTHSMEEWLDFVKKHEIGSFLLDLPTQVLDTLYKGWKARRYDQNDGVSFLPQLKGEEMSTTPDTDPYVCFRRREMKQMRRARRTDEQSLEKLNRLREDLRACKDILDMVYEREKARKVSLDAEHLVFEKRVHLRRIKKQLGITTGEKELDAPDIRYRKRPRRPEERESTKIRIPMQKLRDAANLVSDVDAKVFFDSNQTGAINAQTEENVKRLKAADEKAGYLDLSEGVTLPSLRDLGWQENVQLKIDANQSHPVPFCRRRVGRGGRILFDRHLPFQDLRSREAAQDYSNDEDPWRVAANAFKYDHVFDELDDALHLEELPDTPRSAMYRALTIVPREDEYRYLMNQPSHIKQIVIQPTPPGQRQLPMAAPPQIIRPINQSPVVGLSLKKRPLKPGMVGKPEEFIVPAQGINTFKNLNSKKQPVQEPVDRRTAAVKAMMQQAQRHAQQQLGKHNGDGSSSSPFLGNTQMNGGSPLLASQSTIASPSQLQQQQLRLSQIRMAQQQQQQQQLASGLMNPMGGANFGVQNLPVNMNPQAQQYFLNQQAQQQRLRMSLMSGGNVLTPQQQLQQQQVLLQQQLLQGNAALMNLPNPVDLNAFVDPGQSRLNSLAVTGLQNGDAVMADDSVNDS